jgi:hypothetical protein
MNVLASILRGIAVVAIAVVALSVGTPGSVLAAPTPTPPPVKSGGSKPPPNLSQSTQGGCQAVRDWVKSSPDPNSAQYIAWLLGC